MCDGWFFFFKQKTAYEMRISDWSSDVCSSDLQIISWDQLAKHLGNEADSKRFRQTVRETMQIVSAVYPNANVDLSGRKVVLHPSHAPMERSEEHTSELPSLMRISYAVFCLKKKNTLEDNNTCI